MAEFYRSVWTQLDAVLLLPKLKANQYISTQCYELVQINMGRNHRLNY